MGRHRAPETSDALYAERRARYLQHKDHTAATSKVRYLRQRELRLAVARSISAALKSARQQARRRERYGRDYVLPAEQSYADTRTFLKLYKEQNPCLDCRQHYPSYVMDFDHVRGAKRKDISSLTTLTSVKAEMQKCDLVCANCHRERTFQHSRLPSPEKILL